MALNVLAVAPLLNSPGVNPRTGRHWRDATHAFQPAAYSLARYATRTRGASANVRVVFPSTIDETRDLLSTTTTYGLIAFFCHGSPTGIQCFAGGSPKELASILLKCMTPDATLALYACATAKPRPAGKTPFAYALSSLMPGHTVLCHAARGHTTMNPLKVCLESGIRRWWYPNDWDLPDWRNLWRQRNSPDGPFVPRPEAFEFALTKDLVPQGARTRSIALLQREPGNQDPSAEGCSASPPVPQSHETPHPP